MVLVSLLNAAINKERLIGMNFPKIILSIAFIVTMAAFLVARAQESSFISEKNTTKIGEYNNPIEIKGVTFFVTDKQLLYYKASRDMFLGGVVLDFALIAWLRRKNNKKIFGVR